ncbi:MAG: polysulfide reductase NrfD [Anaerolineae bacterium]|nr:polysulfide reductase NrfD [Anaerolineae bacterium]
MIARLRKHLFWLWIALLAALAGAGVVAGLVIFTQGLTVTNLSDGVPWGLWITLDLSSIGLSAGAFSLSVVLYLLGRRNYRTIARVAVFIGLLGYSSALMCLILDIGRPDRFWHGWVFWNTHSMLWEVTMCITFYFTVLTLEVFPMVADLPFLARFKGLNRLAHRVHRFAPVLAVIGLSLSLLHQSSLGGTYGVVVGRAALFRATMPLLFIVSAVGAGIAFTVHVTLIVQWVGRRILVPRKVLFEAGQIAGVILLLYLYMRFWDTTAGNYGYVPGRTEAADLLMAGPFAVSFWTWEIILGGLVAAVLMIRARFVNSVASLLVGTGLAALGLVANRWHTTIVAFSEPLSTSPALTDPLVTPYVPSLVEWLTGIGIVAGLVMIFSLGMKFLPAFKGLSPAELEAVESGAPEDEATHAPAPAAGD